MSDFMNFQTTFSDWNNNDCLATVLKKLDSPNGLRTDNNKHCRFKKKNKKQTQINKAVNICTNPLTQTDQTNCVNKFNKLLGVTRNQQTGISEGDATCDMTNVQKTIYYKKSKVFCPS